MPNIRVENVTRLLTRVRRYPELVEWRHGMVKRIRDPNITTSDAGLDPKHNAKSTQAWKYAGGKIQRAPTTKLGTSGKTYTDPKSPGEPRRKQESNFFITINTNKSPTDSQMTTAKESLEATIKTLSRDDTVAQYLMFGPCDPKSYAFDEYDDVVQSINFRGAVEMGPVRQRLHAHVWLTVVHYSQVQINVPILQDIVMAHFNSVVALGSTLVLRDKPYVHVKLLPQADWTEIMKQYIHKGMMATG